MLSLGALLRGLPEGFQTNATQVSEISGVNQVEGIHPLVDGGRMLGNPALVHAAKEAFLRKHERLYCEACGFDFFKFMVREVEGSQRSITMSPCLSSRRTIA